MLADTQLSSSDKHYFGSYDHFGIHEEMLKDEVRTLAYRDAMYHNRDRLKDQIVLDVGCGSGILSMFAVMAGAKHVYAVDRSNVIDLARQVVDANGLSSKITFIQGKMEEIELPVKEVGVIVSEWMGYFLIYESMLDTVLYARDKYLKKGGLLLPDKSSMWISCIEDKEYKAEKIGFWKNVYGFDYSPFQSVALEEPLVDLVNYKALVSAGNKFLDLDLYTVTKEDLSFSAPFRCVSKRDDFVHGFVVWFDIEFANLPRRVTFSTGPQDEQTHWKQTVFYTKHDFHTTEGDVVEGRIEASPNTENPRNIDIKMVYKEKSSREEVLYFAMQ